MSPRLKAKLCARCKANVPKHEWPADHRWPVLCSSCIRPWRPTTQTAELAERRP